MKRHKNISNNKYIKLIVLAVLIIATLLSVYVLRNTNNKAYNASSINQKSNYYGYGYNYGREVVNIPDEKLKNLLLDGLKKKRGWIITLYDSTYIKSEYETDIYKDEMEKIKFINLGNTEISDLTGLETAKRITSLNLSNNRIVNIEPLRELTSLTDLNLSNNKIVNIEGLRGLTNLRNLNLGGSISNVYGTIGTSNQISNIEPLSGLINLRNLDLTNNKVVNIEALRGLTNLTSLNLTSNKVVNIEPLSGLTNLTDLNLSINQIENISSLS